MMLGEKGLVVWNGVENLSNMKLERSLIDMVI